MALRTSISLAIPFLLHCSALVAQSIQVIHSTPSPNGIGDVFAPIEVQMSAPLDPATVTPHAVSVFGRWSGAMQGTLSLQANGTVLRFQPLRPLFPGDWVRVDLAGSIAAVGGGSLAGGHHFEFAVRTAPGSGVFQQTQTISFRLPNEGRISTYGIHAGDLDRDGAPDITAINEYSHDLRTFRSDGCATFGPMARTMDGQNWPSPHDSADFNRDGWLDLVTGDYVFGNVSVFLNDGAGAYQAPITLPGGSYIRSVAAGDFDGDGYPDLCAGNGGNVLVWRNLGGGGFAAPTAYTGPNGSAELNVVDADEDGHLDIVTCNLIPGQVWVLIGNGNGTFTNNATLTAAAGAPFASAAGDLNGDGHVDIALCCHLPDSMVWLFGDGNGGFTYGGSVAAGGGSTSIHLGDLEGDGDLDAVLSHYFGADFWIYRNDGSGNFGAPTIFPAVAGAACTTLADFDRDGDLDIMGADEFVDIGILLTQVSTPVPGIQPPGCGATLRLNQRADGAGFGGRQAVPVRAGESMSINLSGPPAGLGIIAFGYAAAAGSPLAGLGLNSLEPTLPITLFVFAILDGRGELHTSLQLPVSLPVGYTACLQGAVLATGTDVLSNPMQFVIAP